MEYKDLDAKGKREYIWDYYKIHIISGIVFVIFIVSILSSVVNNLNTEIILDLTIIGTGYNENEGNLLSDELFNLLLEKNSSKKQKVDIEFISVYEEQPPDQQMANMTKLMGKSSVNGIDVLITSESLFKEYAKLGMYASLDDLIKSGDILAGEDLLVRGKLEDSDDELVLGLDVTGNSLIEDLMMSNETYIISIYANSPNKANAIKVANYILSK